MTALWLALALATSPAAAADGTTREWRFDVTLDGRPIGEHRFVLQQRADTRELTSEASFRVRFLFVDAWRYEHHAQEWWRGDCLERLDARTDQNGERTRVAMPGDSTPLEGCVRTFAYWNPSILESRQLLNPQTGEYVDVEVKSMGLDRIAGQAAEHYRLLGGGRTPLQIDLWYTPSRDWLALESRTSEGRVLRYTRK
jgi:uncharacterized protein DUF6134